MTYIVWWGPYYARRAHYETFAAALDSYTAHLSDWPDVPRLYGESFDDERDGLTDEERDQVDGAFGDWLSTNRPNVLRMLT